ncbi:MAG TPA: TonB-dependent receptor, partial [Xanthomonadaceae bacterium]|nr:TonB-dependent receptor [Xanthomonadaceae bacterium]
MKRGIAAKSALGIALLLAAGAHASPVAEVDLSGHVETASDHKPISGARVEIRELHRTTMTDAAGRYHFNDLKAGSYTLSIRRDDHVLIERAFKIEPGATQQVLDLVAGQASTVGVETLGTVYAIGQPNTDAVVARALQQDAPNLILVQPASEIEKLPDVNAGEAVRRLPGISLETDTGEGRFVNIRGIDADLNSTTFDGVRLSPTNTASPQSGGRAVAFDAIPAGMVGSITVTNTNIPEQDAEALGGTIDIKPKQLPQGKDTLLEAELGYGNEDLRDTPVKDFQLTGGIRFGLGDSAYKPFSFIGTVSYYQDARGIDDIEAAYVDQQSSGVPDKAFADFDQRYYNYQRQRHGYGGELDFQPDDDNRWYLRYYDTGYTEHKSDQHLNTTLFNDPTLFGPDPSNPNGFIDQGATFDKEDVDHKEQIDSRVAVFGGENIFQRFKLDYHASLSIGSYNSFYNYNPDFSSPSGSYGTVQYDNTTNPNYPVIVFGGGGVNPLDPTQFQLNSLTNDTAHDHEQERSGAINLTVPTSFFGGENENMKFGLSARIRDRNNEVGSWNYNMPDLLLSQADTSQWITYYGGRYQNGFNIDPSVIRYLIATLTPIENFDNEAAGFARGEEDVYAGYGQYQFQPLKDLRVLAGVRFESTKGTYDVIQQTLDDNGNVASNTPVSYARNYDNLFPTVQLRYEFEPDLIARAVYSKT